MEGKLLELNTKILLKKFGGGKPTPGSGSAAAFIGLICANLLKTVIVLTTEEKRKKNYGKWFEKLNTFEARISSHLIPELERLFEEDSIVFKKVVELRGERDEVENIEIRARLESQHLEQLSKSTEVLIKIAENCLEVSKLSEFVFKNGFQSARGDSLVALSNSVEAIASCISIINLNLFSFKSDSWTKKISTQVDELDRSYSQFRKISTECSCVLKSELAQKKLLDERLAVILSGARENQRLPDSYIEKVASDLQNLIWMNKKLLWKFKEMDKPIDVLKPGEVLKKVFGYQLKKKESIRAITGSSDHNGIAGAINQKSKVVYISTEYSDEIQKFTSAHELGHAIFHKQPLLHRDRPLDGSMQRAPRNPEEYQADKFAAYFLMPAKQVKIEFQKAFIQTKFIINDDNAFMLAQTSPTKLLRELKDLRGLTRRLASTSLFGAVSFVPLNKLFGVSIEAMAIRLEELELVEF